MRRFDGIAPSDVCNCTRYFENTVIGARGKLQLVLFDALDRVAAVLPNRCESEFAVAVLIMPADNIAYQSRRFNS